MLNNVLVFGVVGRIVLKSRQKYLLYMKCVSADYLTFLIKGTVTIGITSRVDPFASVLRDNLRSGVSTGHRLDHGPGPEESR